MWSKRVWGTDPVARAEEMRGLIVHERKRLVDLAEMYDITEAQVSMQVALLELDDAERSEVAAGEISPYTAYARVRERRKAKGTKRSHSWRTAPVYTASVRPLPPNTATPRLRVKEANGGAVFASGLPVGGTFEYQQKRWIKTDRSCALCLDTYEVSSFSGAVQVRPVPAHVVWGEA